MFALSRSIEELSRARRIIGEESFIEKEGKLTEKMPIRRKVSRRGKDTFDRDFPTFLLSLGSAIRTGQDPLVAMFRVGELFQKDSYIAEELRSLKDSVERGMHEDECIRNFAVTSSHPDLPLFRTAFLLARKQGSSLSRCLERLVRVTRQRQSFRRKVRAAIAMQKLSSLGIGFCALVICLFQMVTNSQGLIEAIQNPTGTKLLAASGFLIASGIVWMILLASKEA